MCSCIGVYILLVLSLILSCDSSSSECRQLEPCLCFMSDFHYYNLTDFADKEPLSFTKYNITVYFHPCKDVPIEIATVTNNTCSIGNGVSLCMYNITSNTTENFGTIHDTKMKLSEYNNIPIFEIHHGNITSIVNIICNFGGNTHFMMDQIFQNTGKYHFILASPYGCKKELHHGLSIGSVLVIIFFTFAGIYFIGGAVTLKMLRGATGWQMLPNYNFWHELPLLVRDGIGFTFNCCRAVSYERI